MFEQRGLRLVRLLATITDPERAHETVFFKVNKMLLDLGTDNVCMYIYETTNWWVHIHIHVSHIPVWTCSQYKNHYLQHMKTKISWSIIWLKCVWKSNCPPFKITHIFQNHLGICLHRQVNACLTHCCCDYSLCSRVSSNDRQRVVLTMMSAGLGACRGHAVVPTYATEKNETRRIMRFMQHSTLL
jgi:hypothetical protein